MKLSFPNAWFSAAPTPDPIKGWVNISTLSELKLLSRTAPPGLQSNLTAEQFSRVSYLADQITPVPLPEPTQITVRVLSDPALSDLLPLVYKILG